ncbi:MAG: hypothetical protein ACI4XB_00615 [Ruminococcus sp.]
MLVQLSTAGSPSLGRACRCHFCQPWQSPGTASLVAARRRQNNPDKHPVAACCKEFHIQTIIPELFPHFSLTFHRVFHNLWKTKSALFSYIPPIRLQSLHILQFFNDKIITAQTFLVTALSPVFPELWKTLLKCWGNTAEEFDDICKTPENPYIIASWKCGKE